MAANLDFALPVKSRSILNSLIGLTDPKNMGLLLIFQGHLALFHAYNLKYRPSGFGTAIYSLHPVLHSKHYDPIMWNIVCIKRFKNRVDCSTRSKVVSQSRWGIPPHWNGTCSKNHRNDEGLKMYLSYILPFLRKVDVSLYNLQIDEYTAW